MGEPDRDPLPTMQRSCDLCVALYQHVNHFRRAQRTLLGRVVQDNALEL